MCKHAPLGAFLRVSEHRSGDLQLTSCCVYPNLCAKL